MSIREFLKDLEKSDSKIKNYFNNISLLKSSLIELDNVIGMGKVKSQIIKQIKTYISTKAKGIYRESDTNIVCYVDPPGAVKLR